jgi:hypothetical protein
MKWALPALFLALPVFGQVEIRNLYLPPWNEKEATQNYTLAIKCEDAGFVKIQHTCTVQCEEVVATTNGIARVNLTLDLKKTPSPFYVAVQFPDPKGGFAACRLRYACHLSLVGAPFIRTVRGDTFAITNLTTNPFVVEKADQVSIQETSDWLLRGTYAQGGALKLRELPEIRFNKNTK